MKEYGRRSKDALHGWRMNVLGQTGREQFNRMMELRDNDVHHSLSDGKTLPTMIPVERSFADDSWMFQQTNYAALGIRRQPTEYENQTVER